MSSYTVNTQLTLYKDIPKCKHCLQQFTTYKKNNESRRAILLPCGHNLCEKCYYNIYIQSIKCIDCDLKIKLNNKMHKRRDLVDFNYFLSGKINALTNFKIDLTGSTLLQTEQNQLIHIFCFLCHAETIYKCIECDKKFCLTCFQKNHLTIKHMQKHSLTRINIKSTEKVIFDGKCNKHSNSDLQYYCNDCNYALCSNCIPLHTNHVFKILLAQNSEREADLLVIKASFERAKKLNENSIKEIKYKQDLHNEQRTKTINNISDFFLYYHGLLQNLENKLLKNIDENAMKFNNDINDINSSLLKSKTLINDYLLNLCIFAEEIPANNDLSAVIEKSHFTLATLECSIDCSNLSDNNPYSFKEIQPPTINAIESLFKFNINTEYCLPEIKTIFESNKNYLQDAPIDAQKSNLTSVCSIKPEEKSSNICEESISIIKKIKFEEIIVTYIKTPLLFYIQEKSDNIVVQKINDWCLNETKQLKKANIIKQNNIYIMLNKVDNKWNRVKVIKLIKNINAYDALYQVGYIDFGNTENVESDRLYELPIELREYPIFVKKCSLYNVKPKNNWTKEINQIMIDIMANKTVKMLILDVINDIHYVDLITISNDYRVSMRDALLYSDLITNDEIIACTHLYAFQKNKETLTSYNNRMLPMNKFNQETFLTVKTLNIISPTNFYLIKLASIDALNQMMLMLNEKYNNKKYSYSLRLYLPKDNMICAVLLPCKIYVTKDEETINESNDWTWYRAKILSSSLKDFCEVFLVDYGRKLKINYTCLYILDDDFIGDSEYALNCALIDIKPVDNNNDIWPADAINDFKNITAKNSIQICVYKQIFNVFNVTMFIIKRKMNICVNALMVKINHATSTGFESRLVNYYKTNAAVKLNTEEITVQKAYDITENISSGSLKENHRNTRKYIKVMITDTISPSEFYICLIKHLNGIKKMHNEIQKYMKNKKTHKQIDRVTLIDEKYFGFTSNNRENDIDNDSNNQWYRIRIIKVLKNNNYLVLLCDFGVIKEINQNNIYLLNNKNINNVCDGIIKCSLAHIKPTGDLKSWLYTSIDTFDAIIEKYNEFSITLENVDDFNNDYKSSNKLSVILWGLKDKMNDALTPHIDNWININKMLVNRGVAHPMKSFDEIPEQNYDNELFNIDFSIKNCSFKSSDENDDIQSNIDVILNDNKSDITHWLPAKKIEKTIFTAIPTYITNTGIIFMHDTDQISLINNMTKMLYDKYVNVNNDTNNTDTFNKNQPCIVRYHLDNYFYRGSIIKKYCKKNIPYFHVLFVDFGNIEKCELHDLYLDVILGEIPIQTSKYCLNNIRPINGNKYTTAVTDYIHRLIIFKQCSIRITDVLNNNQNIQKCELTVGRLILNNVLLEHNYAIEDPTFNLNDIDKYDYYESDNSESPDFDSDADEENQLKSMFCVITDKSKQTNDANDNENDIKSLIRHLSINEFIKQINNNTDNFNGLDNDDDDDINIFNQPEFETSTKVNQSIFKKHKFL